MTLLAASTCCGLLCAGGPVLVAQGWWQCSGSVSGTVGLRVLTGHASLASRLYKMGVTSKTTASFCFLVAMYRLQVL